MNYWTKVAMAQYRKTYSFFFLSTLISKKHYLRYTVHSFEFALEGMNKEPLADDFFYKKNMFKSLCERPLLSNNKIHLKNSTAMFLFWHHDLVTQNNTDLIGSSFMEELHSFYRTGVYHHAEAEGRRQKTETWNIKSDIHGNPMFRFKDNLGWLRIIGNGTGAQDQPPVHQNCLCQPFVDRNCALLPEWKPCPTAFVI